MTKKVLVLLGFLFLFSFQNFSAAENYPFLATVNTNHVNVRSLPDINAERIYQLSSGEDVVVLEKKYDWYRIRLSLKAVCFVSSKFVKILNGNVGTIVGNRINVRTSINPKSTILGQLNDGQKVHIKDHRNGWVSIEPVEGIFGWVAERFIVFKSPQVPLYPHIVEDPQPVIAEPVLEKQFVQKTSPPIPITQEPEIVPASPVSPSAAPQFFSVTGEVKDSGRLPFHRGINFKLITEDKKQTFFLRGDKNLFKDLIASKVQIEGHLLEGPKHRYQYPVIEVTEAHAL